MDNNSREFRRYDTTTSGWTAMSNGYVNNRYSSYPTNTPYARHACLAYDYDRDYIYADVGGYDLGQYIQRYNVSNNSWTTSWLDIDVYTNATTDRNYGQTHTYYNNVLVLGHTLTTGRLYYYNISTGVISYISKDTNFYDATPGSNDPEYANPFVLATDIPTGLTDSYNFPLGIGVWASQIDGDRGDFRLLAANIKNVYGTYMSPIFKLTDRNKSSYFFIENTGNVSYTISSYNGTIKVRSSDVAPLPIFECYYLYAHYVGSGNYDIRVGIWTAYTNSYVGFTADTGGTIYTGAGMGTDTATGNFVMSYTYGTTGTGGGIVQFDRSRNLLHKLEDTTRMYAFNIALEYDGGNGIWGYGNYNTAAGRTIRRFDKTDLSETTTYSESQQNFVYNLVAEYDGVGCWYTNQLDDTLVHMSIGGSKLSIIPLNIPRQLCKTTDNGCWVYSSPDKKVYRYDYDGELVATFVLPYNELYGSSGLTRMSDDRNDGFWFRYGVELYHVQSNGNIDVGPVTMNDPNYIYGTATGCFVYSTDDGILYWVGMDGDISYQRTVETLNPANMIGCFYYGYTDWEKHHYNIIPVSYDPVWKSGGSAEWVEVAKDGYFLPKKKYHQIDIKLWDNARLNGIFMAPAIKTEDIHSQQSKNIYVKTDIPVGADLTDYEIKLRTWWGVAE